MTRNSLVCLAALFTVAPSAAVDKNLLDLAPPDANFVIGVRVAEVADSPLISGLLEEARQKNPELGIFLGEAGSDPFRGLEEVLIVGRAEPDEDAKASEDALAILRGSFGSPEWLEVLCRKGCASETYGGFEVRRVAADEGPADLVMFDSGYAAVGAPERVRQAIDRFRSGASSPFAAAVQDWNASIGERPIWLAATGPFEIPKENMNGLTIGGIDEIDGIGVGIDLGEELDIALELRTTDESGARQLYDAAQGLLAILSMGAQSRPAGPENPQAEIAKLLDSLTLEQEDRRVHASLRVSAEQIRTRIQEGIVKMGADEAAADSDPGPGAWAKPAPRPRAGVIRIYGLEDEAVEVPAGQR